MVHTPRQVTFVQYIDFYFPQNLASRVFDFERRDTLRGQPQIKQLDFERKPQIKFQTAILFRCKEIRIFEQRNF